MDPRLAVAEAGVDGTLRPEALQLTELARLADVFVRLRRFLHELCYSLHEFSLSLTACPSRRQVGHETRGAQPRST